CRTYPLGDRAEDRPSVEAGLELEDRGAGDLVAVQYGVLDRRRTAPGGQQREVQVDPAVPGDRKRGGRDEGAVRDDRYAVRGDVGQPGEELRLPGPRRGEHL